MKTAFYFNAVTLFVGLVIPFQAQAYIGPGMGLGVAVTVLGLVAAFILLLAGLIWLPIRRVIKNRRAAKQETHQLPTQTTDNSAP